MHAIGLAVVSRQMSRAARPAISDPKHPNFETAAKAIERVYGAGPDYTREGGSIPITSAIEEATGMNVLLLPIGACDDMAHSQNEKYNISNLVSGIKVRTKRVFIRVSFSMMFLILTIRIAIAGLHRYLGCIFPMRISLRLWNNSLTLFLVITSEELIEVGICSS